jgi:hypothetical protein
MIQTIVTHPGGAHKDDLLAVCLLVARHGAPVFRRDPTDDELNDASVAVVDIGARHESAKSNFDHHHFDRDHQPICALSLVLQHFGLYEDARHFCDWLEVAEWFDSRGPKKTAEWLGVPRKAITQLNSPIDMTLLRRFAQSPSHQPGETLYEFMRMVGDDLLAHLHMARERIAFAAVHVERWSIPHAAETIEALFLPRTDPGSDEPSTAVAMYIRSKGFGDVIQVIVYPDRRGDGYGIGRYEDHPRFDFSRVQDEPDVHFAHKSGFMCKTTATDPDRLRALIAGAHIDASTPA